MKVLSNFSDSYNEARKKFLNAAQGSKAQIESIESPHKGPNGEPLYTDIAWIDPSDTQNVLVLSSGTHGVEGFTGSGIQTCFLRDEIASHLNSGVGFLLIHAINPYGFAHLRRVNEDNIDLNYNFGDHSKPYANNPDYDLLADAIAPESMSKFSVISSWARIFGYMIKKGKKGLERAISGGQYTHPCGLFYGGRFETWSNKIIRNTARKYLFTKKRIVIIDFHTGLGKYGGAEIMLDVPRKSNRYKRAEAIWETDYLPKFPLGVALTRSLKLAYPPMLPNSEVTAVSLEYGTIPPLKVFQALRLENWLHHHCEKNHTNYNKIKNQLLRSFYPEQYDWKLIVWKIGKDVIQRAISYLQKS